MRRVLGMLVFWPTAAAVWLLRALLRACDTPPGRLALRPVFRLLARGVLYARSLPIARPHAHRLVPAGTAEELIARHRSIAVMPCACRATSSACTHPLHGPHEQDTCLVFGHVALLQRLGGVARRVSRDEAVLICRRAAESGLVHHGIMSFGMLVELCSCCPESCTVFAAYRAGVDEVVRPSGQWPVRGEDCDGCKARTIRTCVRICPYAAGPGSRGCTGCGLCAFHCPKGAVRMESAGPEERRPSLALRQVTE